MKLLLSLICVASLAFASLTLADTVTVQPDQDITFYWDASPTPAIDYYELSDNIIRGDTAELSMNVGKLDPGTHQFCVVAVKGADRSVCAMLTVVVTGIAPSPTPSPRPGISPPENLRTTKTRSVAHPKASKSPSN